MNIVTAWQRATRPRDAFPGPINFAERPAASPPSAAMFDLSGDPDALDATRRDNAPRTCHGVRRVLYCTGVTRTAAALWFCGFLEPLLYELTSFP